MTRDVLPGSRNKTHRAQQEMVASYASQGYALPRGLEAATAILMHHVREGEQLFGDDPWTYTRCQEVVDENRFPVWGFFLRGPRRQQLRLLRCLQPLQLLLRCVVSPEVLGTWFLGFVFRTYMIREPPHFESFRLFHENWPLSAI